MPSKNTTFPCSNIPRHHPPALIAPVLPLLQAPSSRVSNLFPVVHSYSEPAGEMNTNTGNQCQIPRQPTTMKRGFSWVLACLLGFVFGAAMGIRFSMQLARTECVMNLDRQCAMHTSSWCKWRYPPCIVSMLMLTCNTSSACTEPYWGLILNDTI